MSWKKSKTASGFDTLDNEALSAEELPDVIKTLKKCFGKRLIFAWRAGFEVSSAAFDAKIDGIRITIGWDIWSGAFIMAWNSQGNDIIKEIESFL